jgi:hypothetical protein
MELGTNFLVLQRSQMRDQQTHLGHVPDQLVDLDPVAYLGADRTPPPR